ncbi:OB-fold domain-containing protein [Nocardia terpenica]|uniref:Zn-ribbon domain-containing OB-fold protein n=1 Tax=Nocardia terpenica TaxID=455432 RepID=UPI00189384EA|nr:OB-fold nucleic acid binding domain-containing protein [Nocardia terpenica]MBF6062344.1 OB-fold domain-containing protein [Nocardia terpenica]MBF6104432.1 OB-fold domain-containing protein [Nocardia terpenica]MBF6109712.1 OB-fold domain-containing protein [Nocardia terpenica]MBF6120018.1 OB-fold domain-containing protein [Nocardia terpenica]MBF6152429.1 OB-fold domain-containing protein [Nocardia terpenica]
MTGAIADVLAAELRMTFDYTRSVGPTVGRFLTGLREGRIVGVRGSDGRVLVPPAEYDPVTAAPLTEFVEVADVGTVRTWTWVRDPLPGQPFDRPFAWALIQLDGADTTLLHAVDVAAPGDIHTGLRVRVRWAAERTGGIHDIACFEPGETSAQPADSVAGEPVTGIVTPIDLRYKHTASPQESGYLKALAEGRLIGGRADAESKVYFPPRGADPIDGRPTDDIVDLPDTGIITTFCIVNVPFLGQKIKPPFVAAYILLDGADIPVLHRVLGCDPAQVRMGMRVKAVWKPREEWGYTLENVDHFEPTGEPDAEYATYAHHL